MELFRSIDMKYVSLTMTNEAAHATVRELGKFGKMHVVDLSLAEHGQASKSTSHYKKRVQDVSNVERKLQSFKEQLIAYNLSLDEDLPIKDISGEHADLVEACLQVLDPMERELGESIAFQKENAIAINSLMERRQVLNALKSGLITQVMAGSATTSNMRNKRLVDLGDDEEKAVAAEEIIPSLRNVLVGTIATDQQVFFSRMLYRVSRGNAFARFKEIKATELINVETGEVQEKSVFYAVVLGSQITSRVRKMCETFHVALFDVPESPAEMKEEIEKIKTELAEKREIERKTADNIAQLLSKLAANEESVPLRDWQAALQQERAICTALMKAHFYLTMISLEGWIPESEVAGLKRACKVAVTGTGNPPAAIEIDPANPIRIPSQPPTHFPTNKFTSTFQGIVDTYGVPRYKEANPGLFTIISFPFLFGVMYGDVGHGCILTIFAFLLCYYEESLNNLQRRGKLGEIPSMAFHGRYVLLSMGLFAVYCGSVYNDCFSIPLDVYGSSWTQDPTTGIYTQTGGTYPFGIDPAWAHKQNTLAFSNSLKMKMAVALGVTQMLFGVILSLFNHLYFNDWLSVYYEFIPRMVFLLCTFGYMIFMIYYKWCVDWSVSSTPPPNLITTMINMFLAIGSVDPSQQLYAGQAAFQTLLVVLAAISVPVLLFAKPYAHKLAHAKKAAAYSYAGANDEFAPPSIGKAEEGDEKDQKEESVGNGAADLVGASLGGAGLNALDDSGPGADADLHEEFSFSDEMIHNSIHTIEYVLGCVSNTASYLRLWALSLAHAQLADVFWSKMLGDYGLFSTVSPILTFTGFAMWAGATFAVLLCMDVLECFLHALRLHWVEFQNKFFHADGTAFEPFVFEDTDKLYL